MNDLFLLIDGNSLVNRAFYALPPMYTAEGKPSQAVYGFVNMLLKAVADYKPTQIAVAFDLPAPTFRHIEYKEYKATRKHMPDELAVQLPMLKQLLQDMGIKTIELSGFEADDIIGTMAGCKCKTIIITGDRDAFQLIDSCTMVAYTKRGLSNVDLYDHAKFIAEYGFAPASIVDYKALAGDASDNIAGVAGIGDKTASDLIKQYGNIDNVYLNINSIKGALQKKLIEGRESAYLSKRLAKIECNAPLKICNTDCYFALPLTKAVKNRFLQYNFTSLARRNELFGKEDALPQETVRHIKVCSLDQIKIENEFSLVIDQNMFIACANVQYDIIISQDLFNTGFNLAAVLNFLKPALESSSIKKIVMDGKAVKHLLKEFNISLNNYFDVKLAQYLIDIYIKFDTPAELCTVLGFEQAEKAFALQSVSKTQIKKLKEMDLDSLYYDIELPLSHVLFKMECCGFRLDMGLNSTLNQEFLTRASRISEEIFLECGRRFNINSPKQLSAVLFDELKIPYPKKSKSYSTAVEILEPLASEYPVISKVLDYRSVTKLNSTYIEGFKKLADINGVVHTEFKQTLTSTGRLSSAEPNLQNIPIREEEGKKIRQLFIAGEGNWLVCADYSQIELRLLASFSGDRVMCGAFNDGRDIHVETAAQVFDVNINDVTPQMRRAAKAVNFGIIYGISDFGLASNLRMPVKKAKEIIDKYFIKFPDIKNYLDGCIKRAEGCGYATTLFGRMRKIPELNSGNIQLKRFGERVAMNMPLQGSAADIIKAAMIKVDRALEGTGAQLILQIHDELVVECPDHQIDLVKKILREGMERVVNLDVPLNVSIGAGKRWIDC